MKLFLLLVVACSLSMKSQAQDCSTAFMSGYHKDTTVTVDEAKRVILTSFAAINTCNEKLKLRSGKFYYFTPDGEIGLFESFSSTLDNETKLRLIARLKPGIKLMLDEMYYGDANILAPKVSLTLIKGVGSAISSK